MVGGGAEPAQQPAAQELGADFEALWSAYLQEATRFSVVFGAPQAAGVLPIKHRQVGGCLISACV